MHRLLCMRPNQVPIAITTGLGPSGPRTVLHQPPSRQLSPEWNLLDVPGSPEPAAGPSMRRSVQGATHPIHDHHSSDDSSDIEIFPPSSPPVAGKGKKVHPREHGPRANSSSKPTTVARGQGTSKAHMDAAPAVSGGGVVVKKEGMVKEEKTAVKVEKKVKETKETKEKEVKVSVTVLGCPIQPLTMIFGAWFHRKPTRVPRRRCPSPSSLKKRSRDHQAGRVATIGSENRRKWMASGPCRSTYYSKVNLRLPDLMFYLQRYGPTSREAGCPASVHGRA